MSLTDIGCLGHVGDIAGIAEIEAPMKLAGRIFGQNFIGAYTYIQPRSEVQDSKIGRFCSIASSVEIGPGDHPTDMLSTHPFVSDAHDVALQLSTVFPAYKNLLGSPIKQHSFQPHVEIGNDVWIAHGATIRRGVKIGDGAVIAAGAVVVKDVEPYSIVGGVPARHLRFRFDGETVARLVKVKWWEYDLAPLVSYVDFSDVEQALTIIEMAVELGTINALAPPRYRVMNGQITPL